MPTIELPDDVIQGVKCCYLYLHKFWRHDCANCPYDAVDTDPLMYRCKTKLRDDLRAAILGTHENTDAVPSPPTPAR